jgi:hypothetical protein
MKEKRISTMKLMLTIAVMLIGLSVLSQKNDYEVRYYEHYNPKWMSTTPGCQIRKAAISTITGSAIAIMSSYMYASSISDQTIPRLVPKIGIAGMCIGGLLALKGQVHLFRASVILDSRGIGLSIPIGR